MNTNKFWFKYETGYVNVDVSNIYFSRTGNWQEVLRLTEKTKSSKRKDNFRKIRIYGVLLVVFIGVCFLTISKLDGWRGPILSVLGLFYSSYKVYQYFSTDLGSNFRLPIQKITKVTFFKTSVEIEFLNGDNKMDTIQLNGVDEINLDKLQAFLD